MLLLVRGCVKHKAIFQPGTQLGTKELNEGNKQYDGNKKLTGGGAEHQDVRFQ
jgi:hypothetical protein